MGKKCNMKRPPKYFEGTRRRGCKLKEIKDWKNASRDKRNASRTMIGTHFVALVEFRNYASGARQVSQSFPTSIKEQEK